MSSSLGEASVGARSVAVDSVVGGSVAGVEAVNEASGASAPVESM